MKTVFKVGMEVYDQVFFGDETLKIIEVRGDMSLRVLYGEATYCYTGDGRFIGDDIISNRWNCISQIPTLSTSPYTLQGFEQKAPAPTFEEAWGEAERIYEPKSEYDKEEFGGYPSQDLANAAEALRRLIFLREYYNEGWQPDWDSDKTIKHTIETCCNDDFVIEPTSINYPRVLSFKSKKIRNKFFKEQRELLEIAKPLL